MAPVETTPPSAAAAMPAPGVETVGPGAAAGTVNPLIDELLKTAEGEGSFQTASAEVGGVAVQGGRAGGWAFPSPAGPSVISPWA